MDLKIKYLLGFCLLAMAQASVFAQPEQQAAWTRLQSDNGEFSIEMPKNATYFYDRSGFSYAQSGGSDIDYNEMQMLNSAEDKTVMSVEIYRLKSPKKGLQTMVEKLRSKVSGLDNLPEGFTGKESTISEVKAFPDNKGAAVSCVLRFIASKTHLYVVTVANRGDVKTPAFSKFLSSIRLGENQTGSEKISALTAMTINDVGVNDEVKPSNSLPKPVEKDKKQVNPTPLLILSKPFSSYTEAARQSLTSGKVVLRVTFEKDGRISKIGIITSLPNGLTRSAFFAALRIKFIPLEKDGAAESISKPVEYTFSVG